MGSGGGGGVVMVVVLLVGQDPECSSLSGLKLPTTIALYNAASPLAASVGATG